MSAPTVFPRAVRIQGKTFGHDDGQTMHVFTVIFADGGVGQFSADNSLLTEWRELASNMQARAMDHELGN
jgi:hypothetical protein